MWSGSRVCTVEDALGNGQHAGKQPQPHASSGIIRSYVDQHLAVESHSSSRAPVAGSIYLTPTTALASDCESPSSWESEKPPLITRIFIDNEAD